MTKEITEENWINNSSIESPREKICVIYCADIHTLDEYIVAAKNVFDLLKLLMEIIVAMAIIPMIEEKYIKNDKAAIIDIVID